MAHCQGYKDMKERRPAGATVLTDDKILWVMKVHAKESFWKTYEGDRLAYIRRWAAVVRREARSRGLL